MVSRSNHNLLRLRRMLVLCKYVVTSRWTMITVALTSATNIPTSQAPYLRLFQISMLMHVTFSSSFPLTLLILINENSRGADALDGALDVGYATAFLFSWPGSSPTPHNRPGFRHHDGDEKTAWPGLKSLCPFLFEVFWIVLCGTRIALQPLSSLHNYCRLRLFMSRSRWLVVVGINADRRGGWQEKGKKEI